MVRGVVYMCEYVYVHDGPRVQRRDGGNTKEVFTSQSKKSIDDN